MKKRIVLIGLIICMTGCNFERPTQFSNEALNDAFIGLDGNSVTFQSILDENAGETILVDVWASWCKDCIVGMPALKALQQEFPNVKFLFLSLDRSVSGWKNGIMKYELEGMHYYMQSGWDGPFGEFIRMNWIPRYMVVDPQGTITLFKATKIIDKRIKDALQ